MNNLIGIINYGISGNIHSINKALKKAGANTLIITHKDDFQKVSKLIIPGVGSFKDAMNELQKDNLLETLTKEIDTKPTLGICLGMQILSTLGFEYGKTQGLNKISAEVKPMIVDGKIPHMGFNNLEIIQESPILKGVENAPFYFMHSYEVVNYTNIVSLTNYNGHKFVSSIQKDNIFGVQFHPEKSREAGIKVFENFIEL